MPKVSDRLLAPGYHALTLVGHGSRRAFAVASHPMEVLRQAVQGLASAAALCEVPTTVTARHFGGPLSRGVREVFPDEDAWIDRTTMPPGRTPASGSCSPARLGVPGRRRRRSARADGGTCGLGAAYLRRLPGCYREQRS